MRSIVMFEISILQFFYLQNFTKKLKYLNLGPKMPNLGILGLVFENNIFIFEINNLEFVLLQNFAKKQKCLNLGPKMPYLSIFDQKCLIWVFLGKNFKRAIVIFEISNPWIFLIAECCEIMKMPKFETKRALFGYFWARTLNNCCHIWNEHPWISVIAKFFKETKLPKFQTKNALFGYFWPKMPYLGIFEQEF